MHPSHVPRVQALVGKTITKVGWFIIEPESSHWGIELDHKYVVVHWDMCSDMGQGAIFDDEEVSFTEDTGDNDGLKESRGFIYFIRENGDDESDCDDEDLLIGPEKYEAFIIDIEDPNSK